MAINTVKPGQTVTLDKTQALSTTAVAGVIDGSNVGSATFSWKDVGGNVQSVTVKFDVTKTIPTAIALSAQLTAATPAVNTVVGALTSTPTGATFSITSQSTAGAFAISGSNLVVNNGALATAPYTVTVRATNGSGTYDKTFAIGVNVPVLKDNDVPFGDMTGVGRGDVDLWVLLGIAKPAGTMLWEVSYDPHPTKPPTNGAAHFSPGTDAALAATAGGIGKTPTPLQAGVNAQLGTTLATPRTNNTTDRIYRFKYRLSVDGGTTYSNYVYLQYIMQVNTASIGNSGSNFPGSYFTNYDAAGFFTAGGRTIIFNVGVNRLSWPDGSGWNFNSTNIANTFVTLKDADPARPSTLGAINFGGGSSWVRVDGMNFGTVAPASTNSHVNFASGTDFEVINCKFITTDAGYQSAMTSAINMDGVVRGKVDNCRFRHQRYCVSTGGNVATSAITVTNCRMDRFHRVPFFLGAYTDGFIARNNLITAPWRGQAPLDIGSHLDWFQFADSNVGSNGGQIPQNVTIEYNAFVMGNSNNALRGFVGGGAATTTAATANLKIRRNIWTTWGIDAFEVFGYAGTCEIVGNLCCMMYTGDDTVASQFRSSKDFFQVGPRFSVCPKEATNIIAGATLLLSENYIGGSTTFLTGGTTDYVTPSGTLTKTSTHIDYNRTAMVAGNGSPTDSTGFVNGDPSLYLSTFPSTLWDSEDDAAILAAVMSSAARFDGLGPVNAAGTAWNGITMPSVQTVYFGPSTRVGHGGHDLDYKGTGTLTITAGNSAAHWQIDSFNHLVPKSGANGYGTAAPTFAGPYTLTIGDGTVSSVVTVNIDASRAGKMTVRNQPSTVLAQYGGGANANADVDDGKSQIKDSMATGLITYGDVVGVRNGAAWAVTIALGRYLGNDADPWGPKANFNGENHVVIRAETGGRASLPRMTVNNQGNGASWVRLQYLDFINLTTNGSLWMLKGSSSFQAPVTGAGSFIDVWDCTFTGRNETYSYDQIQAIGGGGDRWRIHRCKFFGVSAAIFINNDIGNSGMNASSYSDPTNKRHEVIGCEFREIGFDVVNIGSSTGAIITDNLFVDKRSAVIVNGSYINPFNAGVQPHSDFIQLHYGASYYGRVQGPTIERNLFLRGIGRDSLPFWTAPPYPASNTGGIPLAPDANLAMGDGQGVFLSNNDAVRSISPGYPVVLVQPIVRNNIYMGTFQNAIAMNHVEDPIVEFNTVAYDNGVTLPSTFTNLGCIGVGDITGTAGRVRGNTYTGTFTVGLGSGGACDQTSVTNMQTVMGSITTYFPGYAPKRRSALQGTTAFLPTPTLKNGADIYRGALLPSGTWNDGTAH